jgi:hypothetical protein
MITSVNLKGVGREGWIDRGLFAVNTSPLGGCTHKMFLCTQWGREGMEIQLHSIGLIGSISCTLRPLYRRFLLSRRLGGPQSWCGLYGEEMNLLHLPGIQPWFLGCPAHCLVTIVNMLWGKSQKLSGYSVSQPSFEVGAFLPSLVLLLNHPGDEPLILSTRQAVKSNGQSPWPRWRRMHAFVLMTVFQNLPLTFSYYT